MTIPMTANKTAYRNAFPILRILQGSLAGRFSVAAPSPSVGLGREDNLGLVRELMKLGRQFGDGLVGVIGGQQQAVTVRKADLSHSVLPLMQLNHEWPQSVTDDAGLFCGQIVGVHSGKHGAGSDG